MFNAILSILLILGILVFWMYILLKYLVARILTNLRAHKEGTGRRIEGEVLSKKVLRTNSSGQNERIRIEVAFPNAVGSTISEFFNLVDTKPHQDRYEPGSTIGLLFDPERTTGKPLRLEGGELRVGKAYALVSALIIAGYLGGTGWFLNKLWQQSGGDMTGLRHFFEDSEVGLMGGIMMGTLIFITIVFRAVGLLQTKKGKLRSRRLKYYGARATATITSYEDTGTLINNNPLVRFHYEFTDGHGTLRSGSDKVIIGKLEVGNLPTMKEKDVMYLPDSPNDSRFVENLRESNLTGCVGIILLFLAFVFSGVVIGRVVAELVW